MNEAGKTDLAAAQEAYKTAQQRADEARAACGRYEPTEPLGAGATLPIPGARAAYDELDVAERAEKEAHAELVRWGRT